MKFPVFYKPKKFGEIVDRSLQHFLDASETGYDKAS